MLGSFGVGKTSLVHRFVYNKFDEKYLSTIGVQISQRQISPVENSYCGGIEQIKLILWDIAHIEKFNEVIKNYFRGSHAAIVVFDVTRSQTVEETDVFLKPYLEINPKSKLFFVGNKIDLVDKDAIDMEQLLRLPKAYKASFILTSAKTSENVERMFTKLGTLLLEAD